ncbi:MAG: MFS transporter [Aquificaceae bacterium]|nr:MFS transporter [Aquificaceae bacterium]
MWDRARAYRFIVLMGFVSLLSDFTYEGAKGIVGPYLAHLGASALAVGLVSGASELAGYWVRLLSGLISDRLRTYWFFTLLGYALNLLSVPLLGFVKNWQSAGVLMFVERSGKGLRTPPRDVLLSRATGVVGHGKGFGVHEFIDQIGAVLGPTAVGVMLLSGLSYKMTFLSLFVPAILALIFLFVARSVYGGSFKEESIQREPFNSHKKFYLYLLASCFVSLSFLQFPLIGFHLSESMHMEGWKVALLFALAMGVDALSALLFGFLYDRIGFISLSVGLSLGMFSSPLLFFLHQPLLAVVLWGVSLGVQESLMRSIVASLSSETSRGRAYGFFHFFFGLSAFVGGLFMGYLYELSPKALVFYSLAMHLIALSLFARLKP